MDLIGFIGFNSSDSNDRLHFGISSNMYCSRFVPSFLINTNKGNLFTCEHWAQYLFYHQLIEHCKERFFAFGSYCAHQLIWKTKQRKHHKNLYKLNGKSVVSTFLRMLRNQLTTKSSRKSKRNENFKFINKIVYETVLPINAKMKALTFIMFDIFFCR